MYGQGAVEILPPPLTIGANEYGGAPHPVLLLDNGAWVFDLQDSYLRPSAQSRRGAQRRD